MSEPSQDKVLVARMPDGTTLRRDCCPICGHQFDVVSDRTVCQTGHDPDTFDPDELITEWDDYLWVE